MWTINEVELLLQLTLNYKASKKGARKAQYLLLHEHEHVVRYCCCCCCCCYETLQGSEVEWGWGDKVIVLESMRIHCPDEYVRTAFWDFSTLRPVFKKVRFQALRFQDPCGRSAKTM